VDAAEDIWALEGRGNRGMVRSFMICIPHKILFGWLNKE